MKIKKNVSTPMNTKEENTNQQFPTKPISKEAALEIVVIKKSH